MSVLIHTFWREPAVALGMLVAVAAIGIKAASGGAITAQDVVDILTPLAAALGIRHVVTPSPPSGPPGVPAAHQI